MNYDIELLNNNLQIPYKDFFTALGYTDTDNVYMRTFSDRDNDDQGRNKEVQLAYIDGLLQDLHKENDENRGVFFVVNGDGHRDKNIKRARACFIDGDELPLAEQLKLLCEFPLEPSIIIKTKKSLHAYWITPEGEIKYFRELQERLIQYFKSDPVIKNESRVMRLYGFNHCKGDPVEVKIIKFDPQITYTQRQLHEALPLLEKAPAKKKEKRENRERIPHGQRHKYVVERLGYYISKIGDTSENQIMQTLYADFLENCEQIPQDSEEKFIKEYMPTIIKYKAAAEARATDPTFYRKAMKAWQEENPGMDFDTSGASWDDVAAAGLRAAAEEPTDDHIDNGWKEHTEDVKKATMEDYQQTSAAYFVKDFLNGITERVNTPAISTGFCDLDILLDGGLYEGLYIIGAVSSLGKTTFCIQMADNLAKQGQDCIIFSLEMAKSELMAKSISRLTFLNADNRADAKTTRGITSGARYAKYSETAKANINRSIEQYKEYAQHIYIYEGVGDVGTDKVRELVNQHISITGRKPIIFIDYVQILAPYDLRASDKQNTDKAILELKRISRDFKIPVLGVSSFNRENYTAPVNLASFKESGAIEYGSDVLIGLQYYGMDYTEEEAEQKRRKRIVQLIKDNEKKGRCGEAQKIQIKILKQRNGSRGDCVVDFYPMFNYFADMEEDWQPAEKAVQNVFDGVPMR